MKKRIRVIVAEEKTPIRRMFLRALRGGENPALVTTCADGDEFLALLRRGADCAFLSSSLPGPQALATLADARAAGLATPIIVTLARGHETMAARFTAAGASDYLYKRAVTPPCVRLSLRHVLSADRARAAAAATLRRSQQQYRDLFDSMLEGFAIHEIITDGAGKPVNYRFIDINPAFEKLTGLKRENVVGRTVLDILPAIEPFWIETYGRVALTRQPVELEHYAAPLDRYYHVSGVSPAPRMFAALFTDITDRVRVEEALRDSKQRLEAVIHASPLAICAFDTDFNLRLWNSAAERIFGWREAEVLGKPLPIVPPEGLAEYDRLRLRSLAGESLTGIEIRRRRRDGSAVDVSLSTAPIHDAAGKVIGVMGIMDDITEAKRLKEQLLQARRLETVGRLAGGIAHDFNNMLAVISAYAEAMLGQIKPGEPLHEHAREIADAAARGSSLTRQLLTFSRGQAAPPNSLDLVALLAGIERMLRRLLGDHVRFAMRHERPAAMVRGDAAQIEQMLVNLAINARDAMPHGGVLSISTSLAGLDRAAAARYGLPAGPYVRLLVQDTGVGMDDNVRQRVFEPFFSTKGDKGAGLGLAIAYEIIRQAGGAISVDSAPGHGAAFEILLPPADSAPSGGAAPDAL